MAWHHCGGSCRRSSRPGGSSRYPAGFEVQRLPHGRPWPDHRGRSAATQWLQTRRLGGLSANPEGRSTPLCEMHFANPRIREGGWGVSRRPRLAERCAVAPSCHDPLQPVAWRRRRRLPDWEGAMSAMSGTWRRRFPTRASPRPLEVRSPVRRLRRVRRPENHRSCPPGLQGRGCKLMLDGRSARH